MKMFCRNSTDLFPCHRSDSILNFFSVYFIFFSQTAWFFGGSFSDTCADIFSYNLYNFIFSCRFPIRTFIVTRDAISMVIFEKTWFNMNIYHVWAYHLFEVVFKSNTRNIFVNLIHWQPLIIRWTFVGVSTKSFPKCCEQLWQKYFSFMVLFYYYVKTCWNV